MGGSEQVFYQDEAFEKNDGNGALRLQNLWKVMEGGKDKNGPADQSSSFGDSFVESTLSSSSSSSSSTSDMSEDTSSSSSTSCSPPSYGPLYDLSELMAQLPIKRGLSKYYEGKSQTFESLASVKGLEDLAKKGRRPYRSRKVMESCKSYSHLYSPKGNIAKKNISRVSLLSSFGRRRGGPFLGTASCCSRPTISVHKNL